MIQKLVLVAAGLFIANLWISATTTKVNQEASEKLLVHKSSIEQGIYWSNVHIGAQNIQIGLRPDGVVVWREVKK